MYDDIVAEADRMTVDEYFMKRYVVTGDTMTTYMDMDLMAETEYMYRVKAVNAAGAGMWSDTAMDTTEATDTAPGVATAVTAMETSDTEITVTWGSPASDGGADITGYMVQRAYMGADNMMSEWMDVDPAHMGMDMMYMDTDLMPETTYYYRVAAMNSVGMGEYSDGTASATTDRTNTAPVAGDAIAAQTVTVGGTVMVQSTITDADDTLTWSALSSDDMIATATVDNMGMVTVMGEAPGTATITVTATDAADESATQTDHGYGGSGRHDTGCARRRDDLGCNRRPRHAFGQGRLDAGR